MSKPEAVLNGGELVSLVRADGTPEQVRVRSLSARKLHTYAELSGDEAAQVELVCDKPTGWADEFTIEEFEKLAEVVRRVNEGPFVRLVQRRQKFVDLVAPGAREKLLSSRISQSGSPTSPSPAD